MDFVLLTHLFIQYPTAKRIKCLKTHLGVKTKLLVFERDLFATDKKFPLIL